MEHNSENAEIIIADNGSTDESIPFLKTRYPGLQLIRLPQNYGFAEGYNRALKQIHGYNYFILLNSDIEVTTNWLQPLIDLMEKDPAIAACQPKLLAHAQRELFEYAGGAGGWMDNLGYPFCRGRIFHETEEDRGQYDTVKEIFWASGAALCIRSHLFKKAGGFDGDFFAHLEEIDLCWRLKRAGYKIVSQPRSTVYHLGGGTLSYNTPRKSFLNFRNSLFTLVKNESLRRLLWILPTRLLLDGAAAMLFLSRGSWDHIWAIIRAHWSFFFALAATWRKRKEDRDRVQSIQVAEKPNFQGRYRGSIVWGFYARSKKTFRQYDLD